MKKDDKASISLKKVISISLILLFLMGIGVMAASSKLNNVKIILSDGYEMDVLTSKTNISEILEENHIILLPTETVIPGLDEQISDNNTIKISKTSLVANNSEENVTEELSMEKVLEGYNTVSEKIVKEQVTIPYETEVNDVSTGDGEKEEKITQNGVDGVKEISYKVVYNNGEEVEKTQISEEIISEPVNCVKEIRDKRIVAVTSRSSGSVAAVSGSVAEYQAYAAQQCSANGWSDYDFECLVRLWNRESGWNPNACNRSSGAYGIPQNNNASKYEDWYRNDPYAQIDWGISYISGRYGCPSNAWAHSQSRGWY